ncbi:GCN5-related N-acetyltransferas-like protein [Dothidotthia symphoricarpi CBS 119687]|uniref:GCN5-related N-acetyltransferas-like protein n=1 Tax=Dothidotthia symphoricarpi CBS 119687 TaxID=1392245 RepID=A0A6A6AT51_9PLEO|nr:GCN5-related N-acetyltransferas-like protein [Dothidotthia symphoricarpi CBS 119687]KAF2134358.1 GCN5-related N-acetyltransferas-like protein [Dothidotthia symphoricarpi CBS 119687]
MSIPFVRPYDKAHDFEAGLHVYFVTIDQGLDWEPARTIGTYLWYRPYVILSPSTCFVLDDGIGHVVGYCIGTDDTKAFAQRWRDDFAPSVDPEHVPRPDVQTGTPLMEGPDVQHFRKAVYEADCSMLQSWPQVLQRHPAHIHINVLPEYQGKGWGRTLIHAFFEAVKELGAAGVHLDMIRTNTNGRRFYDKIGFQICTQMLDDGESGETGVSGVAMTLVKTF